MRALLLTLPVLALSACASDGVTLQDIMAGAQLAASGGVAGVDTDVAKAPAGAYRMDSSHANVTWRVSHLGLAMYTGRFDRMSGTLNFNPQDPTASSIDAAIEAGSVSTRHRDPQGQASFDAKIAKDAFGADAHPTIRFVSTGATRAAGNTGTVTGNLTLNGVTKPITLNVTYNGGRVHPFSKAYVIGFSAHTTIKRSAFGVDDWAVAVGDDTQILIEAEFIHQPATQGQ
jgi:polyisoprenoid-binding protein YceI